MSQVFHLGLIFLFYVRKRVTLAHFLILFFLDTIKDLNEKPETRFPPNDLHEYVTQISKTFMEY